MSGKKIILLVVLLIIIAGAGYVYKEYNRANANIAREHSVFTVSATELINDFADNDSAASNKYVTKIISISGLVKNINQDERGFLTVSLGDINSMSSVRCAVDSTYTDRAKTVKPGMTIKLKGNCTGYNADELLGLDVIVNRCVIEEN